MPITHRLLSRRRLLLLALLVLIAAVVLIGLESQCLVTGWLRGEAFYHGRPTSYWAREIGQWRVSCHTTDHEGPPGRGTTYEFERSSREPTTTERYLRRIFGRKEETWPSLLDGDPDGLPVLRELLDDPSPYVQVWAEEGIRRM